jgi:hypothetical protein
MTFDHSTDFRGKAETRADCVRRSPGWIDALQSATATQADLVSVRQRQFWSRVARSIEREAHATKLSVACVSLREKCS